MNDPSVVTALCSLFGTLIGSISGVEDVVLTLENVLSDGTEVRLINGEDKSSDRITTVLSLRGIPIDARLRAIDSAELIRRSFTDGSTDGIEDLLVNVDLETVEELTSVDGGIVTIDTGAVIEFIFLAPAVVPSKR